MEVPLYCGIVDAITWTAPVVCITYNLQVIDSLLAVESGLIGYMSALLKYGV